MDIYPFSSPIILTDSIFVSYGGHTGTSTPAQRTAAYLIAEEKVSDDISTFLLPVTVTGSYPYNPNGTYFTDYAYVNEIRVVRFIDFDGDIYWAVTGTNNSYIGLRYDDYGLVDINHWLDHCNCFSSVSPLPYQVQIMYTAGLPTGTANHSNILLALTTLADITLNEIIGFGNEAPGDIGLQTFKNQEYQETRVRLFRTGFGSSPRAHFASDLLKKFRKPRYVGL